MGEVSTIGLDIAKSVFQVRGVDVAGSVVIRCVGVVAGHLNFHNGKRGGPLSVGTSFDLTSRARAASDAPCRGARLDPAQEKRLQFAFALHVNTAAWLQREGTDEVAGGILGHMDSIWQRIGFEPAGDIYSIAPHVVDEAVRADDAQPLAGGQCKGRLLDDDLPVTGRGDSDGFGPTAGLTGFAARSGGSSGICSSSRLRRRQLCRAATKPFECPIARSTGASARALRIEPAMMMPAVAS